MRAFASLLGLTLLLVGACNGPWPLIGSNDQCVPNPGLCPPQLQCVDGFRQTGGASCENGAWVCGRVACTPDGGSDSAGRD